MNEAEFVQHYVIAFIAGFDAIRNARDDISESEILSLAKKRFKSLTDAMPNLWQSPVKP